MSCKTLPYTAAHLVLVASHVHLVLLIDLLYTVPFMGSFSLSIDLVFLFVHSVATLEAFLFLLCVLTLISRVIRKSMQVPF